MTVKAFGNRKGFARSIGGKVGRRTICGDLVLGFCHASGASWRQNPISFGPPFGANDRTLPWLQAAIRSAVNDRIGNRAEFVKLGAPVVEGCRQHTQNRLHFAKAACGFSKKWTDEIFISRGLSIPTNILSPLPIFAQFVLDSHLIQQTSGVGFLGHSTPSLAILSLKPVFTS